jgi:hypothetical protein
MAMLIVEKAPVSRHKRIDDAHGPVEGELGNLGCLESSLLERVVDWAWILEMDSLCHDESVGLLGGIVRNNKLADISRVAVARLDELFRTDG